MLVDVERERLGALAEANGWTYVEIGQAIGTSGDNVSKMIKRPGKKRSQYIGALDAWLMQWAHRKPEEAEVLSVREDPEPYGGIPDVEWLAGAEIINLGRWFQSSATTDWKLELYEEWVKKAYANLETFRARIKESRKQ